MKQILLSIMLTLNYASILPSNNVQHFYSVNLKLPAFLNEHAHIPAYYKGHRLNLSEGWARLPECGQPCMFSLLITEDIEFTSKGNTVSYLKRIPEQEYSWYDITLTLCKKQQDPISLEVNDNKKAEIPQEQSYTWDIEKRNHDETPERIPEHTIVLLTNPNYIESLKAEPSVPGSIDITLPTIIFKKDINKKEFEETALSILVGAALNLNAIHTKDAPVCTLKKDNIIISLAQQTYESK